jgi:hypothetical protein
MKEIGMILLFVAGLFILNFGISWLNAYSAGLSWTETKHLGGWPHVVNWSAAIMSAAGFTWVYLGLLALLAGATGKLPSSFVEALLSLGYIVIIFPVLGSGLVLTLNSYIKAWRQRNITDAGVAGWNTFALAYDTYRAASALPGAFSSLTKIRPTKDNVITIVALSLVIIAVCGGSLTTAMIIRSTARKHSEKMHAKYASEPSYYPQPYAASAHTK